MTQSRWLRRVGLLVALAAVYVIAGKLGLKLAFENASATPVWPCTGIALAAFVLLGYDVWPAVLAGSFLVNITTAGSAGAPLRNPGGKTPGSGAGAGPPQPLSPGGPPGRSPPGGGSPSGAPPPPPPAARRTPPRG